jgi:hypothetical protein
MIDRMETMSNINDFCAPIARVDPSSRRRLSRIGLIAPLVFILLSTGCRFAVPEIPVPWKPGREYADPSRTERYLRKLEETYPDYVRLRIIGYAENDEGSEPAFPLLSVTVSDNVWTEEIEPEIQIVGGIHGNEQLSCDVALLILDELLSGIDTEESIAGRIVRNASVQIIPILNPWGHLNEERYNVNGVDLNRNFGFAWVDTFYSGDAPLDQAESADLASEAAAGAVVLSLGLHTGAELISWGLDYAGTTETATETYDTLYFARQLYPVYEAALAAAIKYRNTVSSAGNPGFGIIEGYDWYPAYGTLADWMYTREGATAYTIELDFRQGYSDHDPEIISEVYGYHRQALMELIETPLTGIHGRIATAGGYPADATVEIRPSGDPDHGAIPAPYDPDVGDFHAMVLPGEWDIEITASGYEGTVETVTLPENSAHGITLEITLLPVPDTSGMRGGGMHRRTETPTVSVPDSYEDRRGE